MYNEFHAHSHLRQYLIFPFVYQENGLSLQLLLGFRFRFLPVISFPIPSMNFSVESVRMVCVWVSSQHKFSNEKKKTKMKLHIVAVSTSCNHYCHTSGARKIACMRQNI